MKNTFYYLAYKIHVSFFSKTAINIGVYFLIQFIVTGKFYNLALSEGFPLPEGFWDTVYESYDGEKQGVLRVSEDGSTMEFHVFDTIMDEMNESETDPNTLAEDTEPPAPIISPPPVDQPTIDLFSSAHSLQAPPLFDDILRTYGAIAASREIETKVELAKTCIGWVVHKMPPNMWPTSSTARTDYVSMHFLEQYIDNIPKTVSEAQKQGIYLFQAAMVAYTVASARNLTTNPSALFNAFSTTLERNVSLDALGYT